MGRDADSASSCKSILWSKVLRGGIFSAGSGRKNFLYRRYSLGNESRVISFSPFLYLILPTYWACGLYATVSSYSYRSATASSSRCAWQLLFLNSYFSASSRLDSG